ncbi:DUF1345 domain-containing protein [Glaciimonas soli]|uniref:DUF1345 domain-containing protein n=1 Tax=Glaciimonas soli TaxID=2590999 RepID=A0A843YTF3_9BURK|nr:DUF1345 domain-containing protein [Glaciimonas soli]MQR02490.1 DUF1345 domain-containing protein [Glaciimonas soli]
MQLKKLVFQTHPRLVTSTLFAIAVWFLLFEHKGITRGLIAWNAGVWTYLGMVWWMMARAAPGQIKKRAMIEDENATIILAVTCVAAVASIIALVMGLSQAKEFLPGPKEIRYFFTVLTLLGSWFLLGTIFTLHYAHLFHIAPADKLPLRFPEDEKNPDYWDFLYFSFTIGVAVQTSDVCIMTGSMRRTVLIQSVMTFLFNLAILGLAINIAAGLVS